MRLMMGLLVILFILQTFYIVKTRNEVSNAHREVNEIKLVLNSNLDLVKDALTLKDVRKLMITAYSPRVQETDSDPFITASMKPVKRNTIAVSRDLFNQGWVFGKKVYIKCESVSEVKKGQCGIFEIRDLMNARFEERIDIFYFETKKAMEVVKRDRTVALLDI